MLKAVELEKHAEIRGDPATSGPAASGTPSQSQGLGRERRREDRLAARRHGWGVSPGGGPGHACNGGKRLGELVGVERDDSQRIRLAKPADLLESWCESYTWRANEVASHLAPERVTRRFMAEIARAAAAA